MSGKLRPAKDVVIVGAVVILCAVIVTAARLSRWGPFDNRHVPSGPTTTTVRNGEVWLQGTITQDTCYKPIPDAGCSITVNGYEIFIVWGNAMPPRTPGTLTGLDASTDQTGWHADVYARLVEAHMASIFSASKYYARISG